MKFIVLVDTPEENLKFDGNVEHSHVVDEVNPERVDHHHHCSLEVLFGLVTSLQQPVGNYSDVQGLWYHLTEVIELQVEWVRQGHEVF